MTPEIEASIAGVALPPVSQIGMVVHDARRTAQIYESTLGIGPFTIYDFTPDKQWYLGRESRLTLRQAKAMLGPVELEIMQPLEGDSLFSRNLAERGEGLDHLGFNVRDFDGTCAAMAAAGYEALMRAESYVPTYDGTVRACVFDTRSVGGVLFEIIWKSWLPECQP